MQEKKKNLNERSQLIRVWSHLIAKRYYKKKPMKIEIQSIDDKN